MSSPCRLFGPWLWAAGLAAALSGGCDRGPMAGAMMGAAPVAAVPGGALPDGASRGAALVKRYCGQCHRIPAPASHAAAGWPAVVERMDDYMRRRQHGGMMMMGSVSVPSASQRRRIVAYLQRHAQQALDGQAHAKALTTPAGQAFGRVCSGCHRLPAPGQHPAAAWPSVVRRMEGHMRDSGVTVPTDAVVGRIVAFLQRHAPRD